MQTKFARGWDKTGLAQAYSFRFTETPEFVQEDKCIGSGVNPNHREGFDNISLLTRETFAPGAKAEIHCAFEGAGCPEIIIVPEYEACEDGANRYGACFEIVLYKNGINVWRHYREDGKCFWHKRLGWQFALSENEIHTLRVETRENYLDIFVNGAKCILRTDDLFEKFHFGLTVCEGVARVYDLATEAE